jgi:YVTN family beta-propeller protein
MRIFLTTVAAVLLGAASVWAQSSPDFETPVRTVLDPGVIPTRQAITPAGAQTVFESRVWGVVFGPSSDVVYALTAGRNAAPMVYKMDWRTNRVLEKLKIPVAPGMQAIAFDRTAGAAVVAGIGKGVQVVRVADGKATVIGPGFGESQTGGLAVSGHSALVALTYNDQLAVVDFASGAVKKVKTGIAPFGVAVNAAGIVAWVSNWGGRFPKPGDRTARTGPKPDADSIVVDARGVAASGTVTRVDLTTNETTHTVEVGLHPTAMAWDEARGRLYVANSNSDSVSVVDTKTNSLVENIAIEPFQRKVAGIAPEALVLSKDGKRLYVVCAGLNAVAVVAVADRGGDRVQGLIPTAWYPDHIALSPDGDYLAVATMLGVGSGWRGKKNEHQRFVHADRGTLHVISIPDAAQLAGFTSLVAENNHQRLRSDPAAQTAPPVRAAQPLPVPVAAGDPSTIDHVVYIVKENRSYDQMFGDLEQGNGDPSIHLFGDEIVPNQRRLARDFVLLDNFYADGGNSADGHQWVTQASETDYTHWPGDGGRSYPKNGEDPMAFASSGFLWDNAVRGKRTFQDFGEYVGALQGMPVRDRIPLLEQYKAGADFQGTFQTVAPIAPLNRYVAKDYPAYGLQVPDVVRARIFLRHIKDWESRGEMPNLVMVQLPSDHTAGMTAGFSTVKACLADNDLAVGQIVEGLTHSKFWRRMLILVVEDDAQDGVDHVDGHRTVALAISPYIRRGAVDSTFYSQTSLAKTIEQILGLPPMSLFDLIANDMRNSFQTKPDYAPYTAETPRQSIYEVNPEVNALRGPARRAALASAKMNFLIPDAAPAQKVNRMIWASVRGWTSPYPASKKGAFLPAGPGGDDDPDDR